MEVVKKLTALPDAAHHKKGFLIYMNKKQNSKMSPVQFLFRIIQGALIGLGAVLPGISGGVLCVVFGIYKPIMELLSSPVRNFKTHVPKLIPVLIGVAIGFLGVANILSFFLNRSKSPIPSSPPLQNLYGVSVSILVAYRSCIVR